MDALLEALQNPCLYPHPVRQFQVIETHISWVLLTGHYAYKIKKPVNLGFLDFSTLEKRAFYCQEELRLNRRLAPHIYLDVIALTGTIQHPSLKGDGPIIEYAVKMIQFDPQAQMDQMLDRGELHLRHMDPLAQVIAQFHAQIDRADAQSTFGTPTAIRKPVMENVSQIAGLIDCENPVLQELEQWCEKEFRQLEREFWQRKQDGFIRECHGDMHLRNIAFVNNRILIFDGIEFNANLRWIDVMSEIAFIVMDLHDRQQPEMASRLLNRYLEITGDYNGLKVLRFYLTYRAMVRAKVACIRAHQTELPDPEVRQLQAEFQSYLELALNYTRAPQAALIITHGLSGSGKTLYTQALLEAHGFIRLRSDIERKRLFELAATASSDSGVGKGIYTASASRQTYKRLQELTDTLLKHGWQVIVDATFIYATQREIFARLASQHHVPFVILDLQANMETLQQRIQSRQTRHLDASEADLAVLEHQRTHAQPLSNAELKQTIHIDTDLEHEPGSIIDNLMHKLQQPLNVH